jgi:hypothetical protein
MEILSSIYDDIILYNKIILGLFLLFFLLFFLYTIIKNKIIIEIYKREYRGNYKKFTAKRCFEDGTSKYRDYIYLVKEGKHKKCYRIVNLYTLDRLGYPRPSREDNDCFKFSDGYMLGNEIKIHNLFSDIKEIIKIKSDI